MALTEKEFHYLIGALDSHVKMHGVKAAKDCGYLADKLAAMANEKPEEGEDDAERAPDQPGA